MDQLPPGFDLCAIPAGAPPAGETSNLVDPTSLAEVTIALCVITTALAVFFALARIFVNWHKLTLSDYFMASSAVLTITYTGLIITLSRYNRHQWDVPACWFNARYIKIIYAQVTLVGPVLFLSKSAIFLLYRQLFASDAKKLRIPIWVGLISTFLIYFPSIPLSAIFEAPRVGQSWEDFLLEQSTLTGTAPLIYWGIVQGSLSVAIDLYIFILPLPILAKLRLHRRKKIRLLAVFGTAAVGVATSVVALVFRVQLLKPGDSTWQQACLAMCVVAENNVAIIVGSMPAFASFMRVHVAQSASFQSLRSKFVGSRGGSSGKSGYSSSEGGGGGRPLPGDPRGTFGSPMQARKPGYYELNDTELMKSQFSTVDNSTISAPMTMRSGLRDQDLEQGRIVRTVDIFQQTHADRDVDGTKHELNTHNLV
ncbi:hypothetical protein B0T22DRAFT_377891 [Podospora appendiculata]|uniref:Rhodopsin domain-containing protein n=1 Tax=Podospora appendiculata TaxID=314037 RepID=A0AAE0XAN4_9PEZI|nr:hypothetical protein B0T22DRAFT_377891 [Podospora appendiculata]